MRKLNDSELDGIAGGVGEIEVINPRVGRRLPLDDSGDTNVTDDESDDDSDGNTSSGGSDGGSGGGDGGVGNGGGDGGGDYEDGAGGSDGTGGDTASDTNGDAGDESDGEDGDHEGGDGNDGGTEDSDDTDLAEDDNDEGDVDEGDADTDEGGGDGGYDDTEVNGMPSAEEISANDEMIAAAGPATMLTYNCTPAAGGASQCVAGTPQAFVVTTINAKGEEIAKTTCTMNAGWSLGLALEFMKKLNLGEGIFVVEKYAGLTCTTTYANK